jgi:nucleotide-binding universal stress UspA family protein
MIALKRILFPTDFSASADRAFLHALYLAEQHRAELHMLHANLLHAYDPHNPKYKFPAMDEAMQKQLEDAITEHMRAKIQEHDIGNIELTQVQERGLAAPLVILDYAAEKSIDLIVMGTHGRRGVGHFVLGSVAEEVVRMAPCPVLTVRAEKDPRPRKDIKNILAPVDYSEHSRDALVYAKEIAKLYDARLQLLHVIDLPVSPAFYVGISSSLAGSNPDIGKQARLELERVLKETGGPDVDADFHVAEGNAGIEIAKFADEHKSDLIVIATHGLTGVKHFLIGSTAERVVRHASCPVFTVKTPGKSLLAT